MQKSVAFWITSANYHFRCDDQHNAFKSLVRALNSCSERWAITYYNLAVLVCTDPLPYLLLFTQSTHESVIVRQQLLR